MCGGGRQAFHSFLEQHVNSSRGEYYVCGPTGMIDDTVRILKDQGVPDTQLHYEKWW
jgi:ferredoxin-NADP reductase